MCVDYARHQNRESCPRPWMGNNSKRKKEIWKKVYECVCVLHLQSTPRTRAKRSSGTQRKSESLISFTHSRFEALRFGSAFAEMSSPSAIGSGEPPSVQQKDMKEMIYWRLYFCSLLSWRMKYYYITLEITETCRVTVEYKCHKQIMKCMITKRDNQML